MALDGLDSDLPTEHHPHSDLGGDMRPQEQPERRLAAILSADVVGYTRLMATDEKETLKTLSAFRTTISDLITDHSGRIFGMAGSGVQWSFSTLNRRNELTTPYSDQRYREHLLDGLRKAGISE